jgi:ABC-type dipeptide/oligopeptide/nickel transport system permease subunit
MGERMAIITRKERIKLTIQKFTDFIKIFTRNIRGMIGLLIIVFFVLVALLAPLITPYTSLGNDPNRVLPPSGPHSAPSWLRYIPPYLGGGPTLSETTIPIKYPAEMKTKEEGGEFSVSGDARITVKHSSNTNFKYSKEGSGSLSAYYQSEQEKQENVTGCAYKEFDFPYTGAPSKFFGSIMLLVNGTTNEEGKLKIPIQITVFLQAENGTKMKLYPPLGYVWDRFIRAWLRQPMPIGFTAMNNSHEVIIDTPLGGSKNLNGWICPVTFFQKEGMTSPQAQSSHISSNSLSITHILQHQYKVKVIDAKHDYFPKTPGNYKLGIDITFIQSEETEASDETTVYIDEFDFILYGSCFGLLGSNHMGQDLFTQLVYGTRVSLYVGLLSAVLAVGIGLIVGLAAGFLGGAVDESLMRVNDFMLVIPGLPLMMVLVTIFGTSIEILIVMLGLLGWNGFARLVRSQALTIKERPFIEATRAVGASNAYIIFRHLVPNVMPLVYVSLATAVPGSITAEAALSWLGFADPYRISWGKMLHDFQTTAIKTQWWWVIPPGLCIAALAVSFILLGFALDEILNPKLRVRR